jgi:hypothetical protein
MPRDIKTGVPQGSALSPTVYDIYKVSQEERSIFWVVIVLAILSKKLYMHMCPIPNSLQNRAISLYSSYCPHKGTSRCTPKSKQRATCHVLTQVSKCTYVDSGIFENY